MKKKTIALAAATLLLALAEVAQGVPSNFALLCKVGTGPGSGPGELNVDTVVPRSTATGSNRIQKDCTIEVADGAKLEIKESEIEAFSSIVNITIRGGCDGGSLVIEKSKFDISGDFDIDFCGEVIFKDKNRG